MIEVLIRVFMSSRASYERFEVGVKGFILSLFELRVLM